MIVGIATLGPLGRLKAPGTWGSAAGVLWWALVVLTGILICGVAAAIIGRKDPQEVNLDEFVAMPLVYLFNPLGPVMHGGTKTGLLFVLLGFLLFRLFDITKPFGIKALEKLPGGFGIVLDDVMAAFYANLTLHALAWLWMLL